MIIRILGEGQYEVADADLVELNKYDDALEAAIDAGDEAKLTATLNALLDAVRQCGTAVEASDLDISDLILPAAGSGLDELRAALGADGLLPG